MAKEVSQIFEKIKKESTAEGKARVLASGLNDPVVNAVINGAFHPGIKFLIPDGIPFYQYVNPGEEAHVTVSDVLPRIYLWVQGSKKTPPELTQRVRNERLAEILSAMKEEEASVLKAMLTKDMSEYGITKEMVDQVRPGLTG